jgi:hypothetical protein
MDLSHDAIGRDINNADCQTVSVGNKKCFFVVTDSDFPWDEIKGDYSDKPCGIKRYRSANGISHLGRDTKVLRGSLVHFTHQWVGLLQDRDNGEEEKKQSPSKIDAG